MKRSAKNIVRAARQLTGAEPIFVSHVRHGANQTPFRSVKSEDGEQPVAVTGHVKETDAMTTKSGKKPAAQVAPAAKAAAAVAAPKKRVRAGAASEPLGTPEIASIFFPIEGYPTEAAVKDYLTSKNYAVGDIQIEADAMGFVAKGHEHDAFDGDLREIDFKQDGIILTVGFLKAETASKLATKADGDEEQTEQGAGEGAEQGDGEGAGAGEQPAADAGSEGGTGGGEGGDEGANANDAPAEAAAPAAAEGEPAAVVDAVTEEELPNGDKNPDLNTGVQTNAKADVPLADAVAAFDAALVTAKAELDGVATLEAKAADGTSKKFDSIVDVLTYMDDLPPGFYEVVQAFSIVCRSAMKDNDMARIASAAADMSSYVVALGDLFRAKESAEKGLDPENLPADEQGEDDIGLRLMAHIHRSLSPKAAKSTERVAAPAPAATKSAAQPAGTAAEEITDPVLKGLAAIGARLDAMDQRIEQVAAAPAATKGSTVRVIPARKSDGEADGAQPAVPERSVKFIDQVDADPLWRNQFGLPRASQKRG